ncbi:Mediator of RNA polymerase II transcription subunit 12 [Cichlidogyrus casuarinus]|uniref:Mediator of RNA polymerase II transcription subunit 12 n=1 Tax=Cichlidogyrus casuarinus TaxID=1844966 RepID=A0ABD2Q6V7_9PLAT
MSENNVKSGFVYRKPVPDEYETSKDDIKSIDKDGIWNLYYNILSRKFICAKVSESKASQIVAARINSVEKSKIFPSSNFIKDLAGNTPLYVFAKKSPPINYKKEDVLSDFVKYKVPLSKAVWYINRNIQASSNTIETVRKKQRTNADYPVEWHIKICDFLTTLLKSESYLLDSSLDDFDYLFNLLLYLYDANTADHWEVLTWMFETLTSIYSPFAAETELDQPKPLTVSLQDNKHLQFFLPYLLSFGRRFTESEVIVRKVLVWCCATFSQLVTAEKNIPLDSSDPSFRSLLKDYKLLSSCPHHRCLVFSLTTLITALAISCPSACVWSRPSSTCDNTVSINFSYLYSSPLDYLPCPLVALALPPGPENLIELLVQIVRLLDKHEFSSVSYQGLVRQILALLTNNATQLPALLRLLCDWAVTPYRVGMFRAVVIACMIEDIKGQVSDVPSDELSNLIQSTLVDYLANQAPTLHDSSSLQYATVEQDASFRSLICLFGELIDRQLFDYAAYIHYCIALGHVDSSMHPLAMESNSHLNTMPRSFDDENLNSNEGPDSVRSDFGMRMPMPVYPRASLLRQNRHLEYLCHFPLPQDDSYSSEINQRAQLMFGTGRVRERVKTDLKKFVREICRLFSRKTVDIFVVSQSVAPFLKAMQGQQPAPGTVLAGRLMPVPSVVCLMFDLVEISLNIGSLLQLVTDTLAFLRPLQEIRQSKTAALYRSNLCTRGVGILRKYQPVLVTMPELVPKILESLFPKLNMYRNISQVSPIDRCLLLNFEELQKAAPQMTTQIPRVSNQRYGRPDGAEPCYKPELIPEISQLFNEITIQKFIEQMNVSIDIRYTFVIKSILHVVRANSPETVQNACEICTCVTAQCEYLTLEWLLAFKTLLICPERSGGPHLYPELLRVELHEMTAYDNLATLIGTLLTYNYFTLMDFLQRVFNPALAVITQPSVESAENRARYACFILHRIFSWSNHSMLGVLQHQDPGPIDSHLNGPNWSQVRLKTSASLY